MDWDRVNLIKQRLSQEEGTVIKDWGGKLPVALVYPNSYNIGMSNLGIQTIYSFLNNRSDIACERVFYEKENKSKPSPLLAMESQRPLTDFAVIAFSVSYELDYFNVVRVLRESGIPLYSKNRDEKYPLIIAGGPCISANPMPLSPFFDCLCIGEAEAILPSLLPLLIDCIGDDRQSLLELLGKVPGIYVPRCHDGQPVVRQYLRDLDSSPSHTTILTHNTELGDLYLIEAERGCSWGCRFCLVCNTFRPMRFRSVENLIAQAEEGLRHRQRIGLVGPTVTGHPHIEELIVQLERTGARISVSSLRINPLSANVLKAVVKGGTRTIALAPEAGSQRLRDVINKNINEDAILSAMQEVARQGVKQVKLYYMIGLPSETDEDIEEIIGLTLKCRKVLDKQQTGTRITLSVAPFVPKAGTPLQWWGMEQSQILNRRLSVMNNSLQPHGISVKCDSISWSYVQGALSRGDETLAALLANMNTPSLSSWRKTADKYHVDLDYYTHKAWDTAGNLPWGMIDSGTTMEKLKQEFTQALLI